MRAKIWLLAAACVLPLTARAEQIPFITTDELKKLLDAKAPVFLANALSPIEYAEEHIAGSVNVPYEALHSGKVKLPQDRKRQLVFYCKGPK
jgi:rhodanese-related sulfurtransferase